MIDLQVVTDFMMQNFEQVKITKGGVHFLARCLLCGDSKKSAFKKRFNLNYNNGTPGWHCWNCGEHGNFYEIYSIVKGISYDDAVKELRKYDGERIKNVLTRPKKQKREKIIEKTEYDFIIDDCYSLNDENNRYVKALKKFYSKRRISKEYKIYIAYKGEYRNRIIIPIFDEDKRVIYFQARRIPGTGITPKYNNPPTPKEIIILNEHRFDKFKPIVVGEGLIDAFSVGRQGTTCLGKEVSEDLLEKLFKLTTMDIIIALDNDSEAYKSLDKFMKKNRYAKKVKYFLYPSEFSHLNDINNIACSVNKDVFKLITLNSVNYFHAESKLKQLKLLEGKKANENYKNRNRLYKDQRKKLHVKSFSKNT